MKPAESIHKHSVTVRGHELKIKPALLRRLAILALCLGAAVICASLPAAAQTPPVLSVTPNPAYVGQEVTVTYQPSDCWPNNVEATGEDDPTVNVNGEYTVSMSLNPDGSWSGTHWTTDDDAGIDTIYVYDDVCYGDTLEPTNLTVVKLKGVTDLWNGYMTDWSDFYPADGNGNRNLAVRASTWAGDIVAYGLDIVPDTVEAASLVTWCNNVYIESSNDKSWAYNYAYLISGPITVNASIPYYTTTFTTPNITNWLFWVTAISVNTSGAFNGADKLDISKPQFDLPISPGEVAGPFAGQVTKTFSDCQSDADVYSFAATKAEIKATLEPSGVGNVLSNSANFSFNTQLVNWRSWEPAPEPVYPSTWPPDASSPAGNYVPDISCSGALTFTADISQQVVPTNDMIFAIDAPGTFYPAHVLYNHTYDAACAQAYEDQVFINGDNAIPVSDVAYWHNFVVAGFSNKNGAQHIAMYYSAGPDNAPISLPSLFYPADPNTWATLQYIEQQ